jgi:integrase
MPGPVETFRLPRGMGSLVRYTSNAPWTWRHWDDRVKDTISTPTNEINRSKAEQFVYQQLALRDATKFRLQGVGLKFSTVTQEYSAVRATGRGCKKLRESTITALQGAINAFERFLGDGYAGLQIDQVDSTLLQSFVDGEARRISADASNRNLGYICQILEFARKRHYILRDPSDDVQVAYDNDAGEDDDDGILGWPCPTPEEVRLILANAKPRLTATGQRADNGSDSGRPVYSGINQNDYTDFYASICLTGMRLGEARFLTWPDVDRTNKVILIRPGHKNGIHWQPKSRSSIRRIAMVPELEVILNRLRQTNKKNLWVFETRRGSQLGDTNPTQRLGEGCRELGFANHYVLHSLRKYWASTVAQQGMPWQVMLKMFGHSDFELILRVYYAQNDDARLVAEATKIDFGLNLPKTA